MAVKMSRLDRLMFAVVLSVLLMALLLALEGCALRQPVIKVETEHYGRYEVQAMQMAYAHVQIAFPDFAFKPAPLDNLTIVEVPKGTARYYCKGRSGVIGCFNFLFRIIHYEEGDQEVLVHEMVHYGMFWNNHPEVWEYHKPMPWHKRNHYWLGIEWDTQ
jgi:hypothetical protein